MAKYLDSHQQCIPQLVGSLDKLIKYSEMFKWSKGNRKNVLLASHLKKNSRRIHSSPIHKSEKGSPDRIYKSILGRISSLSRLTDSRGISNMWCIKTCQVGQLYITVRATGEVQPDVGIVAGKETPPVWSSASILFHILIHNLNRSKKRISSSKRFLWLLVLEGRLLDYLGQIPFFSIIRDYCNFKKTKI